jgi:SAM-dependent methyltransferase
MVLMKCAICGGTTGTEHVFREMKYGKRDKFDYWECLGCGCLQVVEIPANMGAYYLDDFYTSSLRFGALEPWLYRVYHQAPSLVRLIRPAPEAFQSVIEAKPKRGARILDVGCGGGKLVNILRRLGYDAHGIDPFVQAETAYVRRAYLQETKEKEWDLIMFHHSLEHMSDHVDVLRSARERLAVGGTCLVRIPVANWAWKNYKENWAQLDAPRHFIIHTPQSFRLTFEAAGFRASHITFDSGPFQFYASELYERDIPLTQVRSHVAQLGSAALRQMKTRSSELNRQQLGDQAAFFLKTDDRGREQVQYAGS